MKTGTALTSVDVEALEASNEPDLAQEPLPEFEPRGRSLRQWSIVLLLLAACSSGESAPDELDPRPDVIVLMLDTLRPDHLPVFGYPRATAPFLSDLAGESVRFPRAFSTSSWTAPATASVFTGLYPPRHGVLEGMVAQKASTDTSRESLEKLTLSALPDSLGTLPERLQRAGYETFGVAANINVGDAIGFSRGFDRYAYLVDEDAKALVDRIVDWKSEIEAAQPFFLYAHFNDVHEPYHARSPWIEEFRAELPPNAAKRLEVMARYDSEIAHLDAELRRLFEVFAWRSPDRARETIVVVLSDHGEEFWEHGKLGHGYRLFDELNRVLLFVHAPLRFGSREVQANVSLVDVLPTIEELIRADRESESSFESEASEGVPPVDGRSLVPLLERSEGGELPREWRDRSVFAHRFKSARWWRPARTPLWAVIEARWKLIAEGDASLLFDLASDPEERRDQSARESGRVAAMRAALDVFRERAQPVEGAGNSVEFELDEETRRRLQELGYVDGNGNGEDAR